MAYIYNSLSNAFKDINRDILNFGEIQQSRLGPILCLKNVVGDIVNPEHNDILDNIPGRINKKYAEAFYELILSGSNLEESAEVLKEFSNVAKYLTKGPDIPKNYDSLYGPRIIRQLPVVIEELERNPHSRRAVIHILEEGDNILLPLEENTLEYSCTLDIIVSISEGKLNLHYNMRSQNTAVVMQMDMYVMTRLMKTIATKLDRPVGVLSFNLFNAHIYVKDIAYINNICRLEDIDVNTNSKNISNLSMLSQVAYMHSFFGISGSNKSEFTPEEKAFRIACMREEIQEYEDSIYAPDQLDALVDLVVFALGTAERKGMLPVFKEAFNRVMVANCNKTLGPNNKRGSFELDLVKPKDWKAPDLKDLTGD